MIEIARLLAERLGSQDVVIAGHAILDAKVVDGSGNPWFRADLVIFDPERIRCGATFADPKQYPEDIEWVLVNGLVAVERGKMTAALAGRVLRFAA